MTTFGTAYVVPIPMLCQPRESNVHQHVKFMQQVYTAYF